MHSRRDLHHIVLDVELVLISVVQGVALTTLAAEASPVLRSHELIAYAFVGTGLLFVLSFWSVALVHAISFLTWPMDLVHYYFYFGVALLECLTFTRIAHPHDWFGFSIACFALSAALYAYDYRLILRRRADYGGSEPYRALFEHIRRGQRFEMLVLMPAGLLFSVVAWMIVGARPSAATPLAVVQLLLAGGFLVNFLLNFGRRQRLITACTRD